MNRNGKIVQSIVAGCVALMAGTPVTAQVLQFDWAKSLGGTAHDESYSVAVDDNGNVYTTGHFRGTADFDPGTGTYNLTAAGERDIFISKLDAQGNFVWAKSFGATGDDESYSITTDNAGNVYATGAFTGTVDFDPGTGTQNLTATVKDIVIIKLNSGGNYVWARNIGGPGSGSTGNTGVLKSIAVDASQNVYITGSFNGTADFDPGTGISNLSSAGAFDIYISKLDASGNFVWARRIGNAGSDESNFIAIDVNALYITGSFSGTVDFDPGSGTNNITAAGMDMFIAKFDTAGNFTWAKSMGGGFVNVSLSIAVNKSATNGNIYTTGYFFGTTDFDPGPATFNLTSAGSIDAFVCKLDAQGNFVWAKNMGGTGNDLGTYLVANMNENIFLTGYFQNTADFDPGSGTQNLVSAGSNDAFIAVLNSAGEYVLAKAVGGTGSDFGSSIATDLNGNIYTTGSFVSTADFDPGAGTFNMTSAGEGDIFVHKLAVPCVNTSTPVSRTSCGSYVFNGETMDTSGTYHLHFTSVDGCDSNIVLSLQVTNINDAVSLSNQTITAAESGATYQWINCAGNTPVSGATGQSYTATANGSYAVVITKNSCSDTSACTAVTGISGIHELASGQVRIFPNPAQDYITIQTDVPLRNAAVLMKNIAGQVVLEKTGLRGDRFNLRMAGLAPGIYFLEIVEGAGRARVKVVKN